MKEPTRDEIEQECRDHDVEPDRLLEPAEIQSVNQMADSFSRIGDAARQAKTYGDLARVNLLMERLDQEIQ